VNQPPETAALLNLGLNRYEAAAYVALTRRGRATGAEVARLAGLPRQRIYDVLDGLVGRGLATVEPGRPAYYAAVDPDHAIALLLDGHRSALQAFEQQAAHAIALLGPAYRAGRTETDPLNYIEVLREPGAIARRFGELQAGAQRELLIFTKPPYAVEPGENTEGLALLSRGVVARSVYERSVYDDPAVVDAVRQFVEVGERARVVGHLPLKLVVIDERFAVFTMEDPVAGATDLTIMIVEHPGFAAVLKLAFEHVWESGEDFG
jgi:HTH-type transcriptional regulator, sugar sensing transcriptional regulator